MDQRLIADNDSKNKHVSRYKQQEGCMKTMQCTILWRAHLRCNGSTTEPDLQGKKVGSSPANKPWLLAMPCSRNLQPEVKPGHNSGCWLKDLCEAGQESIQVNADIGAIDSVKHAQGRKIVCDACSGGSAAAAITIPAACWGLHSHPTMAQTSPISHS
jgi:hypothetical protein